MDIYKEIIDEILLKNITDRGQIHNIKLKISAKYKLKKIPSNIEILSHSSKDDYNKLKDILKKKPSRTYSGVAVVAVMTSPYDCPHGKCSYCPGGKDFETPQSYTGKEPAALRAISYNFDPYEQTKNRIIQLDEMGHSTDKIDLIIMGGTFPARDEVYQESFIKRCFDAMNCKTSKNINEAHTFNETAKHRCVGLTVESRPDYFMKKQIDFSLDLGVTRVELGVQTTCDDVLEFVNRDHTQKETKQSTQLSKDAGLKVCYHLMPGLPKMSPEKDIKSLKKIFEDSSYRPDMLKIYPALVIEGTELYEMWKTGDYKPYDDETLIEILLEFMKIIPPWVRIQRIQRDIPAPLIKGGTKKGNLRQILFNRIIEKGIKCNEIRFREVGRALKNGKLQNIELKRIDYQASKAKEIFLSWEDENDIIIGFARLRKPYNPHRKELQDSGLIRELKVFGESIPLSEKKEGGWQHKGYGKKLMKECERIVKDEFGFSYLAVTSGVGVRNYYRELNYKKSGQYMIKEL